MDKKLKVWFNEVEITKYLVVTDLKRGIGTTRNNNTRKNGKRNFEEYDDHTLGVKPMQMGFALISDVIEKRRELADIFNVSEPAPLVFSDEEVYYLAVPDGDIDFDDKKHYGEGTIFWLVPDGVAHAVDPKEFSNVNKEPVTIKSDFAGKVTGSEVECPHVMMIQPAATIPKPSVFFWEPGQVYYDNFQKLNDGKIMTSSTVVKDYILSVLLSYNILEEVQRAYPFLFEGLSESEQVEKLKEVVISIVHNSHGKGSSPLGNKVYQSRYDNINSQWIQAATSQSANISNLVTRLADEGSLNTAISDKGLFYGLLHADPSDGTTPSSVSLGYTDVEITLKLPNGQVVTIVSEGTSPSYPLLEATMHGENGAMSFINDTGNVIQVGDPESIDGFDYQVSDKVVVETMANKGKWEVNKGEVLYPNYLSNPQTPNDYSGDFDWTSNPSSVSIVYPKTNKVVWIGGKMHQAIPPNSNGSNTGNFAYTSRFMFDMSVKSLGRIQFQTQNGNEIPFGVIFRDSSANRRELIVQIYVHKELVYSETLSNKKFNGYFFELSLERFGSELTTRIGQIGKIANGVVENTATFARTINLESIKGVPITSITQNGGGFAKETKGRLEFTDTRFTWVNVDKWQNVPNIFNKGDVLVIDTEAGKGYLNDVERPELLPLGNQYDGFQVSKGTTDILCVPSTWADMPDVKGIVREAFL